MNPNIPIPLTSLTAGCLSLFTTDASAFIFFENVSNVIGTTNPNGWEPGGTVTGSTVSSEFELTNGASLVGSNYGSPTSSFLAANPTWSPSNAVDYAAPDNAFWDQLSNSSFHGNIRLSIDIRASNSTAGPIDYSILGLSSVNPFRRNIIINEDTDASDGITVIHGFDVSLEWLGSSAVIDPGGYTGRVDDGASNTIRALANVVETIGGTTGAGGTTDVSLTALDQNQNPVVFQTSDIAPAGPGSYQDSATETLSGATLVAPTGFGTTTATWNDFGNSGSDFDQLWFHGGGDTSTDLISQWTLSFDADSADPTASFTNGTGFSFSFDGASSAPAPEPSHAITLLLGLAIAGAKRRR